MSKARVEISFLTQTPTHSWRVGQALLASLVAADPRLEPDRAGYAEESLEPIGSFEEMRRWWAPPGADGEGPISVAHSLEWKRRARIKSFGSIMHAFRDRNGDPSPGDLNFSCDWQDKVDYTALFESWARALLPDIAMIHAFSPEEQLFDVESIDGEWTDFRRGWVAFQSASLGYSMKPTIPYIGWGMIYGGRFAARVDPDALRAEGFAVEPLGDSWYVKVTDRLSDSLTDLPAFARRRQAMKALFPDGTFLVEEEPFAAVDG